MGVPSLFRWFKIKFPGVIRKPSPNGKVDECDNLYIDANSIVHNASHPQDRAAPATEGEMLEDIASYIDHVIKTAKPTKLVLIAIDGVAPQAKISQQRSRRFKAAKDAQFEQQKKQEFMQQAKRTGIDRYDRSMLEASWDSNTITPGTPFMAKLDTYIQGWILKKIRHDEYWKDLVIVFSGSAVPGEGEHKAMEFIRRQRAQKGYKPLRHCFYGPDADLIMLALATHEPDFRILREDPQDQKAAICSVCQEWGHSFRQCTTTPDSWILPADRKNSQFVPPLLIFFDLYILRHHLAPYLNHTPAQLKNGDAAPAPPPPSSSHHPQPIRFDLERAIDDFIVLVTMLGNDFLPSLPLPDFEIYLGAIDRIVDIWKITIRYTGSYLTKDGIIRVARLRELFKGLSDLEPWSDKQELPRLRREIPDSQRHLDLPPDYKKIKKASETPEPSRARSEASQIAISHAFIKSSSHATVASTSAIPMEGVQAPMNFPEAADSEKQKGKRKKLENADSDDEFGYDYDAKLAKAVHNAFPTKDTYYKEKFGDRGESPAMRQHMANAYVEGLCWVLAYYHQGCPSWDWVYPEHYAPYPSDTSGIGWLDIDWARRGKGEPVLPFYQLMMVFPPASAPHIPEALRPYMTNPSSPIIDFYPQDFKIDMNGKKQEWKGIPILPRIDIRRLTLAIDPIINSKITEEERQERNRVIERKNAENARRGSKDVIPLDNVVKLAKAEMERNVEGRDRLYVSTHHHLYPKLRQLHDDDLKMQQQRHIQDRNEQRRQNDPRRRVTTQERNGGSATPTPESSNSSDNARRYLLTRDLSTVLVGSVRADRTYDDTVLRNQMSVVDMRDEATASGISVIYYPPPIQPGDHKSIVLPDQPPIRKYVKYRIKAEAKNRKKGDWALHAGQTAASVAEEYLEFKRTGIKKTDKTLERFQRLRLQDDPVPFTPLPQNYSFIFPTFPPAKNFSGDVNWASEEELEEEEPGNGVSLVPQNGETATWGEEVTPAPTPAPQRQIRQVKKESDESSADSDEENGQLRKGKAKVGKSKKSRSKNFKAKALFREPSVKREEEDDDHVFGT